MRTKTGTKTGTESSELYVLECTNVKGAILIKPEYRANGKYGMLTYQLRYARTYDNKERADNVCDVVNQVYLVHELQFKVSTLAELRDTQKPMNLSNKESNT